MNLDTDDFVRTIFDPFSSETILDPYPALAALRRQSPISWNQQLRGWLFTSYDDVKMAQRDKRFSAERVRPFADHMAATDRPELEAMGRLLNDWLLFRDPPAHTPLRRLLVETFTPRAIENLRPKIGEIADDLLADRPFAKEIDLMAEFAFPFPATVIAHILGVPSKDLEKFRTWSNDLATVIGNSRRTQNRFDVGAKALVKLTEYFEESISARGTLGGDARLIDILADSCEGGGVMTKDELIATCILILFAGHETTMHLIGNAVALLLQNRSEQKKVQDNPELIPAMIEEVLRYESSVFAIVRVANESMELKGKKIAKGDRVFLMLSAANRDPEHFHRAEEFDINRSPNRHISFGYGIHFCIGAQLARVEAEVAFTRLLPLLNGARLVSDELDWDDNFVLRGVRSLKVNGLGRC